MNYCVICSCQDSVDYFVEFGSNFVCTSCCAPAESFIDIDEDSTNEEIEDMIDDAVATRKIRLSNCGNAALLFFEAKYL